jgi:hypothetical protein
MGIAKGPSSNRKIEKQEKAKSASKTIEISGRLQASTRKRKSDSIGNQPDH